MIKKKRVSKKSQQGGGELIVNRVLQKPDYTNFKTKLIDLYNTQEIQFAKSNNIQVKSVNLPDDENEKNKILFENSWKEDYLLKKVDDTGDKIYNLVEDSVSLDYIISTNVIFTLELDVDNVKSKKDVLYNIFAFDIDTIESLIKNTKKTTIQHNLLISNPYTRNSILERIRAIDILPIFTIQENTQNYKDLYNDILTKLKQLKLNNTFTENTHNLRFIVKLEDKKYNVYANYDSTSPTGEDKIIITYTELEYINSLVLKYPLAENIVTFYNETLKIDNNNPIFIIDYDILNKLKNNNNNNTNNTNTNTNTNLYFVGKTNSVIKGFVFIYEYYIPNDSNYVNKDITHLPLFIVPTTNTQHILSTVEYPRKYSSKNDLTDFLTKLNNYISFDNENKFLLFNKIYEEGITISNLYFKCEKLPLMYDNNKTYYNIIITKNKGDLSYSYMNFIKDNQYISFKENFSYFDNKINKINNVYIKYDKSIFIQQIKTLYNNDDDKKTIKKLTKFYNLNLISITSPPVKMSITPLKNYILLSEIISHIKISKNIYINIYINIYSLYKYIEIFEDLPFLLKNNTREDIVILKDAIKEYLEFLYTSHYYVKPELEEFNYNYINIRNSYTHEPRFEYLQFLKMHFPLNYEERDKYVLNFNKLHNFINSFNDLPLKLKSNIETTAIINIIKQIYENNLQFTLTAVRKELLLENIAVNVDGYIYNKSTNMLLFSYNNNILTNITENNIMIDYNNNISLHYITVVPPSSNLNYTRVFKLPEDKKAYHKKQGFLKKILYYYLPTDDENLPGYYKIPLKELENEHPVTKKPLSEKIIKDIEDRKNIWFVKNIPVQKPSSTKTSSTQIKFDNPLYGLSTATSSSRSPAGSAKPGSKSSASSSAKSEPRVQPVKSQSSNTNTLQLPGQVPSSTSKGGRKKNNK